MPPPKKKQTKKKTVATVKRKKLIARKKTQTKKIKHTPKKELKKKIKKTLTPKQKKAILLRKKKRLNKLTGKYELQSSKSLKEYLNKRQKTQQKRKKLQVPKNKKTQKKLIRTNFRYNIRIISFKMDEDGKRLDQTPQIRNFNGVLETTEGYFSLRHAKIHARPNYNNSIRLAKQHLLTKQWLMDGFTEWILDIDEATYSVRNRFTKRIYDYQRIHPVRGSVKYSPQTIRKIKGLKD